MRGRPTLRKTQKETPFAGVKKVAKKVGSAIAKGLKAIPSKRGHGALKRK